MANPNEDRKPAQTGTRVIDYDSVSHVWPMEQAARWAPAKSLVITIRDDGEILCYIEDDWDEALKDFDDA